MQPSPIVCNTVHHVTPLSGMVPTRVGAGFEWIICCNRTGEQMARATSPKTTPGIKAEGKRLGWMIHSSSKD